MDLTWELQDGSDEIEVMQDIVWNEEFSFLVEISEGVFE